MPWLTIAQSVALSSKDTSTLDPIAVLRQQKEKQRKQLGRASQEPSAATRLKAAVTPDNLKKQLEQTIKYPERPLPPLNPTVKSYQKQNTPDSPSNQDNPNKMSGSSTPFSLRAVTGAVKDVDNGKNVKIKKEIYNELIQEFKKVRSTNTQLTDNCKRLTDSVKKLSKAGSTKDATIKTLQAKVTELSQKRKKGKLGRKDDQVSDVNEAINTYVKDVLFRTVKFAQPGKELRKATTAVWEGIKGKMKLEEGPSPLSLEDFIEIYDGVVLTALSGRRQYAQTRCEVAAQGTTFCHVMIILPNLH